MIIKTLDIKKSNCHRLRTKIVGKKLTLSLRELNMNKKYPSKTQRYKKNMNSRKKAR